MHKIIALPANVHVFCGKENAEKLRRELHLAYWEKKADLIVMTMPEDTYTFSCLFLKTLMGHGRNLNRYQWIAANISYQSLIDGHLRLLRTRSDYHRQLTWTQQLKASIEYATHAWEWRRKCHTS